MTLRKNHTDLHNRNDHCMSGLKAVNLLVVKTSSGITSYTVITAVLLG